MHIHRLLRSRLEASSDIRNVNKQEIMCKVENLLQHRCETFAHCIAVTKSVFIAVSDLIDMPSCVKLNTNIATHGSQIQVRVTWTAKRHVVKVMSTAQTHCPKGGRGAADRTMREARGQVTAF